MKPLLIFRHIDCEGPGYLAEVLKRRKVPFETIRIDQGDAIPQSPGGAAGLVFMGGPMSVNDPLPWIEQELSLIRQAAQKRMPLLGHCLGGQLISKALGAQVGANPVKEIGWFPVERIHSAEARAWLGEKLPDRVEVFHWHGESFSLPLGAVPLLRSQYCENQGYLLDHTLALQCHVEMTAELVMEWVERYPEELHSDSPGVQGGRTILSNLKGRVRALQGTADVLYERWLEPLTGRH